MKNKVNNTAKYFKSKFENHKVSPPALVWDSIENELNTTKPFNLKFKYLGFFALAIFVVLSAIFAPKLFQNKNETLAKTIVKKNITTLPLNSTKATINTSSTEKVEETTAYKKAVILAAYKLTETKQVNQQAPKLSTEKEINEAYLKLVKPRNPQLSVVSEISNSALKTVPLPQAVFTMDKNNGCVPLLVSITNNSLNIQDVVWDFGNGKTSTEINPQITYNEEGEYTISLTVSNQGYKSTHTQTVLVHKKPIADFAIVNKQKLHANTKILLENNSVNANSFLWKFDNFASSSEKYPEYTFNKSGNYTISLKVTSKDGCSDEISQKIKLGNLPAPTAFTPKKSGSVNIRWLNNSYASNKNNIFHPILDQEPDVYKLQIFNRHGQLLFESNEYHLGWNGYIDNLLPEKTAVYLWKCYGIYPSGEKFSGQGDVTAIY